MIRLRCPRCDSKLRVPNSYANKVIKCPKCDQAVRVPHPPSEPQHVAQVPPAHGDRPEFPEVPPAPADPAEAMAQASMQNQGPPQNYGYDPAQYHQASGPGYYQQAPYHRPRLRRRKSGNTAMLLMGIAMVAVVIVAVLAVILSNREAAPPPPVVEKPVVRQPHPDERVPPNKTPYKAVIPEGAKTTPHYDIERFEAWILTDQSNDQEKAYMTRLKMKNITSEFHGYKIFYDYCTSNGNPVETIQDYVTLHPGQNYRLDSKPPAFPAVVAKQFTEVHVRVEMDPNMTAPAKGS